MKTYEKKQGDRTDMSENLVSYFLFIFISFMIIECVHVFVYSISAIRTNLSYVQVSFFLCVLFPVYLGAIAKASNIESLQYSSAEVCVMMDLYEPNCLQLNCDERMKTAWSFFFKLFDCKEVSFFLCFNLCMW